MNHTAGRQGHCPWVYPQDGRFHKALSKDSPVQALIFLIIYLLCTQTPGNNKMFYAVSCHRQHSFFFFFALHFPDKYSITEIRLQDWELRHVQKSICNLFLFSSGFQSSAPQHSALRLSFHHKTMQIVFTQPPRWNYCVLSSVLVRAEKQVEAPHVAELFSFWFHVTCLLISMGGKRSWNGNDKSDNAYPTKRGNTQYSNGCSSICTKNYS